METLHLGNRLFIGRSKRQTFEKLKDKVFAKLNGWKSKLLSSAGR